MHVPLLDLKAQYAAIRSEIRPVLDEVCESQYFIMGPKVEAFERNAAAYCGAREAIGLSPGPTRSSRLSWRWTSGPATRF